MENFEISLDHERRLILAKASGTLRQKDGEKIISTARKNAAQTGYDILYDIRRATTEVLLSSWFNLPRNLEIFQDMDARRVKAAVLASPDDKAFEDYKFYETVTQNIGLQLKVFTDEREALEWLGKNSFE